MKSLKKMNKKGFTLIEIIVVMIIVGVLASLALPRLFSTVDVAKATEPLNTFGEAKRAADRCAMLAGAGGASVYDGCVAWRAIGLENPTTTSTLFTYSTPTYVDPTLTYEASLNTDTTSKVRMTYNTTTGAIVRSGTVKFIGIK